MKVITHIFLFNFSCTLHNLPNNQLHRSKMETEPPFDEAMLSVSS